MSIEIERKFLVDSKAFETVLRQQNLHGQKIAQGYLARDPQRSVRVRITDDSGFLTIKGSSYDGGTSRFEWEQKIPLDDAEQLLELCLPDPIIKTRYEIKHGPHVWEVDVFAGKNQGLMIAEVELQSADESISLPGWARKEVTGDVRYYNSRLSSEPYQSWPDRLN